MKCSTLQTLFFAATLLVVNAQVPSIGHCPDVTVKEDFDAKEYLGVWYEQEKYPFFFELLGKCIQAEYGQYDNGTVSVVNSQLNRLTGNKSNITGTAEIVEPGKLKVSFSGVPEKDGNSNYWVLSTDYKTYSVVYSCSEAVKYFKAQVLWILTRERNPPRDVIKKAYEVITKNNLSKTLLIKTNQVDCTDD